jgi:hypothetical protein
VVAETTDGQRETAKSGQSVTATPGQRLKVEDVKPLDAVHWALYYPSVLDSRPADLPANVRLSLEAYRKGDIAGAFVELERLGPGLTIQRSSRTTRAPPVCRPRWKKPRTRSRNFRRAMGGSAIESIIAVVCGDKAGALRSGQEAVTALPQSAPAWIALARNRRASISRRAQELETAVSDSGAGNALAHARLAEILLSLARFRTHA